MANTSAVQDQTGHYLARRRLSRALLYLVLAVGAVIAIVPFIYMLETSFKTYGEYGARIAWPAGLTPAPYVGRPRAQEVVVQMTPTDAWQNAPHSFSPDLEGVMLVDKVTPFIQQKAVEDGESLPLQVLILAIDTTNDDTQNYDTFYVTVGSRIIQQFTTRIKGRQVGGPNYYATDRGRWGPHFQVLDPDPSHFVVKEQWNVGVMLMFNYIRAWTEANFSLFMRNSVIITVLTVAGVVVTGTLAAYAFARMWFPLKNFLLLPLPCDLHDPRCGHDHSQLLDHRGAQ